MTLFDKFDWILEKIMRCAGIDSRFLDTPHGRHHYYEAAGKGGLPTVVLIHGMGASAAHCGKLMLRFRKVARRVIALDLPGHGLSEPLRSGSGYHAIFDAGCETLHRLLSEPSIVWGNSMGGAFVLEFSRRFPQLVSALILCSPAGAPMSADELDRFRTLFELSSFQKAYRFVRSVHGGAPWYAFLVAPFVRQMFASATVRSLLNSARPLVTRQQLHSLSMPILFIRGKADQVMPVDSLRFYRENLPKHAQIDEPADFGHCPQLDHHRALYEKILQFVCNGRVLAQKEWPHRFGRFRKRGTP